MLFRELSSSNVTEFAWYSVSDNEVNDEVVLNELATWVHVLTIRLRMNAYHALELRLNSEIKRHIRPGIPQLIALCHARRYGKVENGRKTCAMRRVPVVEKM